MKNKNILLAYAALAALALAAPAQAQDAPIFYLLTVGSRTPDAAASGVRLPRNGFSAYSAPAPCWGLRPKPPWRRTRVPAVAVRVGAAFCVGTGVAGLAAQQG